MSDETGYIVKPATTATDPTPETAIRLQLIWWQQQCYGQEVDIKRLQARVDELEAVVREAYEVWAGSEGLMQPATAPEAYVIRLIDQMAIILGKALTNSEVENNE